MPADDLKQNLRHLAQKAEGRTHVARLKEVIDEVEHALTAGVGLSAVYDELVKDGFTFSFSGFKSALYRIRENSNAPLKQTDPKPTPRVSATSRQATAHAPIEHHNTSPGIKSAEQLKVENPFMSPLQITRLYAEQYDGRRTALSKEEIAQMEAEFAAKQKTDAIGIATL
jgi:hypothetical protein